MAPGDMAHDATLTPLERRRWKQLQRQLEADDTSSAGTHRTRIRITAGGVLALLLAGAALGGSVGATAVIAYIGLTLALYGFHRVVWRNRSPQDRPRDLI
jgi:hypothetical protein